MVLHQVDPERATVVQFDRAVVLIYQAEQFQGFQEPVEFFVAVKFLVQGGFFDARVIQPPVQPEIFLHRFREIHIQGDRELFFEAGFYIFVNGEGVGVEAFRGVAAGASAEADVSIPCGGRVSGGAAFFITPDGSSFKAVLSEKFCYQPVLFVPAD